MSVLTTGVPQCDIAMKTHYSRRCHFHKDLSAEFTKRQANFSVKMRSEAAGVIFHKVRSLTYRLYASGP